MITNFEKISWKQILTLIKVINSCASLNLKTVTRWYLAETTNFEENLRSIENLRLIKIKDGNIITNKVLEDLSGLNDESIKQFFIKTLFRRNNSQTKYFSVFFENFELINGRYVFICTTKERLKHSGIRNFLIDLGVISFEPQFNGYSFKLRLLKKFTYRKKVLAYNQFQKILEQEEKLGHKAEVQTYKYEKNKFKEYPNIQNKIKHISLENVLAGYDIISFEMLESKKLNSKYIEVKAVSDNDWKFYWSRNEMSKAKELGKNYYLYLIPVENGKVSKSLNWKQIKDPYSEVFSNEHKWEQTVETISFALTN